MGQFFVIHPDNPQHRLIKQAVSIIQAGGVVVFPTDSVYAIGCQLGDKGAVERIRQIRQLDEHHHFTLLCRNLSEIATYALVNNTAFRFIKANTPGPYTFILRGTKEVPKRLLDHKRKTLGLRVPDSPIVQALLKELDQPLMSVTLALPHQEEPLTDPQSINDLIGNQVDLVINGGHCGSLQTTIIDLVSDEPVVVRHGKGESDLVF